MLVLSLLLVRQQLHEYLECCLSFQRQQPLHEKARLILSASLVVLVPVELLHSISAREVAAEVAELEILPIRSGGDG